MHHYHASLRRSLRSAPSFRAPRNYNLTKIVHRNVEKAIQNLPPSEPHSPSTPFADARVRNMSDFTSPHAGEESARPLAISTPSISEDAKRLLQKTGDTISKPLNAIGRIFSEAVDGAENKLSYLPGPFAPFEIGRENRQDLPESGSTGSKSQRPPPLQWHPDGDQLLHRTHHIITMGRVVRQYKRHISKGYERPHHLPTLRFRRLFTRLLSPYDTPSRPGPYTINPCQWVHRNKFTLGCKTPSFLPVYKVLWRSEEAHISRTPTPALDIAGVQAQIDLAHEQASSAAKATLRQIFPAVDVEVIDWVLEANEGDLGKSIEQLLEIGGSGN
jgi:hypothetical protein